MLELKNICFSYTDEQPILKDISLTVGRGEFIAIAGRNGSGKTTLTRLMMALIKPLTGSILLQGKDAKKYKPADMARYIGYVFQNPDRQIFHDTVIKEVSYGPEQLGFEDEKIKTCVQQALAATGLTDLAQAYPPLLSKGHKQLVAIASALAMQPEFLILDEPTSGLDAGQRESLMQLLVDLQQQGKTILLVTHDMDLLVRYASRAIVIADGRKVFDGKALDLFMTGQEEKWGLAEPTAVKISRQLADYGVPMASTAAELYGYLRHMRRSKRYA